METIKLQRFRALAPPSPIVNVELPERAGGDSPVSASRAGGTLPVPRGHARPCTPTRAGAAGAPGRGRVANAGLGSFYRNRKAVAENAFSIEQNKNTFYVRVCVCVCARVCVCAQPGGLQAKGLANRGDLSPLRGVSAWWGPTREPPERCKHEAEGAGQCPGLGAAWRGGVGVACAPPGLVGCGSQHSRGQAWHGGGTTRHPHSSVR